MKELPDLVLAYGNSDEFRYVINSHSTTRRSRDIRDRHLSGIRELSCTWVLFRGHPQLTCYTVSSSTKTATCLSGEPGMNIFCNPHPPLPSLWGSVR